MTKFNAVLFDLDGVLVDSINAWYHIFNDTLRYFGVKEVSRKEFLMNFGEPIEVEMEKYFIGKTIEEVKDVYHINFEKRIGLVKLFPQTVSTLHTLKEHGIKIGLITNAQKFIVITLLNNFKIKKYFNVIITMDDAKRGKPAPDMVLRACKLLKVSPKDVVLIGDTKNDIIAGRNAGCITVGYKIDGDYRIESLDSVLDLVKGKKTIKIKQEART